MNNNDNTAAWTILGFEKQTVEGYANRDVAWINFWTAAFPEPDGVEDWMAGVGLVGREVFALGILGYEIDHEVYRDWRAVGLRFVRCSIEYFSGDWRNSFNLDGVQHNRVTAKNVLPWSNYYRHALAISAARGAWSEFDKLLNSLEPDFKQDEGTDDRTIEDNWYQMWLAAEFCGKVEEAVALRERIESGKRRSAKMLLAAGMAIWNNEHSAFTNALDAYINHYRSRELKIGVISTGICWDGTVLYHLAIRRGFPLSNLSELNRLLIAEYQPDGLSK